MNITVKAVVATFQAAADIFSGRLDKVKAIDGMVFSFTIQSYRVSLLEGTKPAGGNVLGMSPSDGPLVSILILLYWNETEDDETVVSTAREILEDIDRNAASRSSTWTTLSASKTPFGRMDMEITRRSKRSAGNSVGSPSRLNKECQS